MSEEKKMESLSEEELGTVSGGATRNYLAALDVMAGRYGNDEVRKVRLQDAGYNYEEVQRLVNGLAKGYDKVARDVIDGRYGNNEARVIALTRNGFDAALVQDIVNGMLMN